MVKSTGWSLCSGCVFSKWNLSLHDIKLSLPSALRQPTQQAFLITHHCTGEAKSKICVIFSSLFHGCKLLWWHTRQCVIPVLCLHANIHHKLVHVMVVVFLINSLSTASCTDANLTVWPGLFGDS